MMKKLFLTALGLLLLFSPSAAVQKPPVQDANDFQIFWTRFKAAIRANDKQAVADMTRLPFDTSDGPLDRAAFIRQYNVIFDARTRRCILRARPTRDQNVWEIFCHDEIYLFEKVNASYKFTSISAND